jgi:hypothetical protein
MATDRSSGFGIGGRSDEGYRRGLPRRGAGSSGAGLCSSSSLICFSRTTRSCPSTLLRNPVLGFTTHKR